jgi:hypothetical protein
MFLQQLHVSKWRDVTLVNRRCSRAIDGRPVLRLGRTGEIHIILMFGLSEVSGT